MMYHQNFVAVLVCGGDILREFDGNTVRIPFGSDYSIRLKNKEARKAVASVEVDGTSATEMGPIIVPGGETVELEGFMGPDGRVTHKFRFIQKTTEISKYRGDKIDDGIITIQFQFEQHDPIHIDHHHHHHNYPCPKPWCPPKFGGILRGMGGEQYGSDDIRYATSCSASDSPSISSCSPADFKSLPVSDEGITVKGAKSDQNFVVGHTKPLESNVYTISLRLRGVVHDGKVKGPVRKPILVRTKLRCTSCGRVSSSGSQFCSNCGTALV